MTIALVLSAVAAAGIGFFTFRKVMENRRIMHFHNED